MKSQLRWPRSKLQSSLQIPVKYQRCFTALSHERVRVRCGSAGDVNVDLFNIANLGSNTPLLIYLPPKPNSSTSSPTLPQFLQSWPVASINYGWYDDNNSFGNDEASSGTLRWPTPIHHTTLAYAWLAENLSLQLKSRRDIFIYGSHLGAGLAASLALTESHPHKSFLIRGLIAYNGVYNWTMFLPDHRINKARIEKKAPVRSIESKYISKLQDKIQMLFDTPDSLFDCFASPSLFFQGPGLHVPKSFKSPVQSSYELDSTCISPLQDSDLNTLNSLISPPQQPRKSHLTFPPRQSTLKIPASLFLYDSPLAKSSKVSTRKMFLVHNLETQALELAELMRRSLDKVELKERRQWDTELGEEAVQEEIAKRIRILGIEGEATDYELNAFGERAMQQFITERA